MKRKIFILCGILLPISLVLVLIFCLYPKYAENYAGKTALEADEAALVSSLYTYDEKNISDGNLNASEYHILMAYRTFKAYFRETYPNDSFAVTALYPASPNSPTGVPYDSFYICVNNHSEIYVFRILEENNTYKIVYDTYQNSPNCTKN